MNKLPLHLLGAPWHTGEQIDLSAVRTNGPMILVRDADGFTIAHVSGPQQQILAKLIAAAPRLYEELRDLAEFMHAGGYDIPEAFAALAAARGEPPSVPPPAMSLTKFAQQFAAYEFGKDEDETDADWHNRLSDVLTTMAEQAKTALGGAAAGGA